MKGETPAGFSLPREITWLVKKLMGLKKKPIQKKKGKGEEERGGGIREKNQEKGV